MCVCVCVCFLQNIGAEEQVDEKGNVELSKLGGKSVTCAVASTPLEAWGKACIKLGLIDEIMFENGLNAVKTARADALKEAKEKLGGGAKASASKRKGGATGGDDEKVRRGSVSTVASAMEEEDVDPDGERDPPSEKEKHLRHMVSVLEEELEEAVQDDAEAAVALADTRISALGGPMLCNPFPLDSKSAQSNWMSLAVRKEKTRMGSTGNKRKIVGAADLLERNDTFYNPDIEVLIEGLPGSEYCTPYIFSSQRSGGNAIAVNRQWIQEAQLRQEKEAIRRSKLAKEAEVKETQQREKNRKRQKIQDLRDEKKRQKMEEEEEKKKARIEERLSRLRVQVDERLFKEASFQREKVVAALARSLNKEYQRRRRAAEIVAGQCVMETKPQRLEPAKEDCLSQVLSDSMKVYSEDTVRVWDFVATFGSFFVERGYLSEVPSLDSLQDTIDCIRTTSSRTHEREEALTVVKELSIALCKPLAISLTRVLFASLIALNPILQKEFGAAFFNEISTGTNEDKESLVEKADVLLPVNDLTWREIARQCFVADALGELGLQRHEVAHLLRGYRSAGHPNSKEAQRLRKAEGFSIYLVQQELTRDLPGTRVDTGMKVRIPVPCAPSFEPGDYRFYLHVAHSLPDLEVVELRDNLKKAVEVFKELGTQGSEGKESFVGSVDEILTVLKDVNHPDQPTKPETKVLKKARRLLRNLVSKVAAPSVPVANDEEEWPWKQAEAESSLCRESVGHVTTLSLSKEQYKKFASEREDYMEEALRLKAEAEEDGGANEDDDDDDDDDEVMEHDAEVVTNGDNANTDGQGSKDNGDQKEGALVSKVGKETPYDEYCGDIPEAPDLIRRCLAVLRTLSLTNAAEPFHYPVDPQLFPNYYDSVLRPMCLSEAGKRLQKAAKLVEGMDNSEKLVEKTVQEFGRNIRLIGQNCIAYANAGPMVIAAGTELVRVFERLFLDWVLAPEHLLQPLENLDDDRCVEPHESDESGTVLLCDGCEGKYNIARLKPPLKEIPKGDWYCPRCISGRWWGDLDPRIGKPIALQGGDCGVIEKCMFRFPDDEGSRPSLMYVIRISKDKVETMPLGKIDELLKEQGKEVAPVRCLEAVAESPGYGFGVDHGLRQDLVPVLLNPRLSEAAAQAALSSSVFRDTVAASATLLLVEPKDMGAFEWLRLLVLLVMKCSASEVLQNIISKLEGDANESMAPKMEQLAKVTEMKEILPEIASDKLVEVDEDSPQYDSDAPATSDLEMGEKRLGHSYESREEGVMVDAGNIEVVEEVVADKTPPVVLSASTSFRPDTDPSDPAIATSAAVPEETIRDPKTEAMASKAKRQKITEDSFAAYAIKNQLKPAVASFEVDNVSPVVDASLSPVTPGLDFNSLRCRGMTCDFCGLSDSALGAPLMRVPNFSEWNELIPHGARGRKTHLVAEIPISGASEIRSKLVSMKIRVDGELVSEREEIFDDTGDIGMTDFLPRSDGGFQSELEHRYDTGLPFVTGSLSAHECCATAAHRARKELMLQKYKDHKAVLIEQEAGITCGRCLEIGTDSQGRSYWKFNGDAKSLFVSEPTDGGSNWYRFSGSEGVASVLVALKRDPLSKTLQDYYPDARALVNNGTWTDLLLRRKYPRLAEILDKEEGLDDDIQDDSGLITVEGGYDPYDENEEILVEDTYGDAFWDAIIVNVSRKPNPEKKGSIIIDAYEVQYTGWSTRFVEWVSPSRVVEPNEHNRALQTELQEENAASRCGLPTVLNHLYAKDFLSVRDRARGGLTLSDFGKIASRGSPKSEERRLAIMKAALLSIEAALPVGSIHNTNTGTWRPEFAKQWRRMVKEAEGPAALTRLVIYLEDMVSEDWKKESVAHLLSCLPHRWKAIGEATTSALAIRITVLDRTIKYATTDRKRYSKKKRR